MASTFTLGDHTYSIGRIPARTQDFLMKRIAPFAGILSMVRDPKALRNNPIEVLKLFTDALANMSDDDFSFVLDTCFAVVKRQQGTGWAEIAAPGTSNLMFEDIDQLYRYLIVGHVLQDSLGPFVGAAGKFLEMMAPPAEQISSP